MVINTKKLRHRNIYRFLSNAQQPYSRMGEASGTGECSNADNLSKITGFLQRTYNAWCHHRRDFFFSAMQRKLFVANRPADGHIPAEQHEASDFKLLCLARVDARQHKDEVKLGFSSNYAEQFSCNKLDDSYRDPVNSLYMEKLAKLKT